MFTWRRSVAGAGSWIESRGREMRNEKWRMWCQLAKVIRSYSESRSWHDCIFNCHSWRSKDHRLCPEPLRVQTRQTAAARPSRSSVENSQDSFRTALWQSPISLSLDSSLNPGGRILSSCRCLCLVPPRLVSSSLGTRGKPCPVVECPAPQVPRSMAGVSYQAPAIQGNPAMIRIID